MVVRAQCSRQPEDRIDRAPRVEGFADIISPEHNILNKESESRLQYWYAVVVQDIISKLDPESSY